MSARRSRTRRVRRRQRRLAACFVVLTVLMLVGR